MIRETLYQCTTVAAAPITRTKSHLKQEWNVRPRTLSVGMIALAVALFFCATRGVHATSIGIDLGPAPRVTSQISASFHDIDGTMLQGQSLSLDLDFNDENFIRLFSITDPSFAALLTLQTNGTSLVGFLQGTGYLLDQNGQAMTAPMELGSASGDNGSLAVGLFPLLSSASGAPLDFFGIHFDLLLPDNASIWLTGGELDLLAAGASPGDRFGIGPGVPTDIVPDFGGTLLLLAVGVAALHGIKIGLTSADE